MRALRSCLPARGFYAQRYQDRGFFSDQKELALTSEQAEYFLRSRRSIRTYQDKPIEREKLEKLISIARYAPTGGNSQQIKWLVVNERKDVKKMAGLVVDLFRYMIEKKHPLAEQYRLYKTVTAWESGIDGITRGAPALIVACAPKDYGLAQVDCASALSYLDLAAPTLGLGSCLAGFLWLQPHSGRRFSSHSRSPRDT